MLSNSRSLFTVLNVTEIIFGWPEFESNSGKSMECSENEGGTRSLAFLTQLSDCKVEAKLAIDEEPEAIVSAV